MIITIESSVKDEYYTKATIEYKDEADIFETIDNVAKLLQSYGYAKSSVREGILALAEDMKEDENAG